MTDYLTYWKPETAQWNEGQPLDHAGSNQFEKVSPGDVLWVVTFTEKRLWLLGRIVVGWRGGSAEAKRRLNTKSIWPAQYHVISRPGTICTVEIRPIHTFARELRFTGKVTHLPAGFDARNLQTIRELTPESAGALDKHWATIGAAGKRKIRGASLLAYHEAEERKLAAGKTKAELWKAAKDKHGAPVVHGVKLDRYVRDRNVAAWALKRAAGHCDLCRKPAPFSDLEGLPFLEVHHVDWLARGGADSVDNTVALCPNCHRQIHVLDSVNDTERLRARLKSYHTGRTRLAGGR